MPTAGACDRVGAAAGAADSRVPRARSNRELERIGMVVETGVVTAALLAVARTAGTAVDAVTDVTWNEGPTGTV